MATRAVDNEWETISGGDEWETVGSKPANAREELRAKAFAKTPAQLQKEIRQQQVGEENAANESWLPAIGTGGAAVVRTAGGMIPGGPIASEPLAQLYENVAGTRQGFSLGMMAAETGLSLVPGGKIAKGALKLAPRIGKTGAQVAEHAIMGEAAAGLPAAVEGQPYTPGLGAVGGAVIGEVGSRFAKKTGGDLGGYLAKRTEQDVVKANERPKKLIYGALSEGTSHGSARAQRLEREVNNGAEPVLDFAVQSKRKLNTREDIGMAARDMTKVTDVEFNNAVDRVGDRMVSGKPVAQAIRGEITDLVRMQNPSQAEGLERLAASFDRDMPIREVNQLRQEITGKLDNYYSKSPLQREHSPLGIEADSAMADGLRDVLYGNLEQIYDGTPLRQMMRERGAAEGIAKFATETSGTARRRGMAETGVRGPIATPLKVGAKITETVFSPTETSKKVGKYLNRPDKKISEAFKLYIPKKSTISAPIGDPLRPQFPKDPLGGAPVVGESEAGAAYGARRQSLGQQQPDLTPAQLDELMRSQSIPGVGQTQMPFAPPGVGAMGSELPNQFDPLQSQISMPNALSQRFSRTPPEQAMPPVTSGESAAAYQARQQSLFEQNPQITPDELAEAMRSQAIPSAGQEFLPFVESRIGGEPQSLGGIQGTQGPTFPQSYGPPDPRIELLRNAGAPLPPEFQNALSPQFQPNPLLDRDVVAQSRAQSAQGPNRVSMGEAAISGQDPPLSSFLNYQGADPRTIQIDENFVRTAKSLQMTPEQLQQLLRQMP